jgi:hypothetical protein
VTSGVAGAEDAGTWEAGAEDAGAAEAGAEDAGAELLPQPARMPISMTAASRMLSVLFIFCSS